MERRDVARWVAEGAELKMECQDVARWVAKGAGLFSGFKKVARWVAEGTGQDLSSRFSRSFSIAKPKPAVTAPFS